MAAALDLAPARDPTDDAASRCAALAGAGGAVRRELAAAAGAFVAIRGWERLGFARLADHAVERLGVSGREIQDLARTDAALARLPRVDAALVSGRLSWTKARLLARVAVPEDEERWLGVAVALSARGLAHEVRAVDVGSLEAGERAAEGEEEGRRETLQLRCSSEVKGKWHRARRLAPRVAGQTLAPWQCVEAVAAETWSAVSLDAVDAAPLVAAADAGDAAAGVAAVRPAFRQPGAQPSPVARLPRAEVRALRAREDGETEGLDAFALDARLRELVAFEQRADARLADALLAVAEGRRYRALGSPNLDAYARDALGLSPRRARMLLRLARAARRVPQLGRAWRSAQLSFLQAYRLVPVALAAPEHVGGWIARAREVTCRQLEEEVDAALLAADLDPGGFAADGGLGAAQPTFERTFESREVDRQPGAQATAPAETSRLLVNGPADVMRLLRATLCTLRRRIERRTGRCPTQGEAFGAMLDHALAEWLSRVRRPVRRAERVYARDGWRCTVPGCSSYRNLEDHHVVFRSLGGSHALANRTTLCAWHHHRGVHAGRVRCTGTAPDGLRFELGLRASRPPLLGYPAGSR